QLVEMLRADVAAGDAPQRVGSGEGDAPEVVALLRAQARLELRDDVEPDGGHRDERDGAEDERELVLERPQSQGLPQSSWKRYPTRRSVRIICGFAGSSSSFSRRWRMCTSMVRWSRYSLSPSTCSSNSARVKTRPGWRASAKRISNSKNVSLTGSPSRSTVRFAGSILRSAWRSGSSTACSAPFMRARRSTALTRLRSSRIEQVLMM